MDIIKTEDRGMTTEVIGDNCKLSSEGQTKFVSSSIICKTEKKKFENKKLKKKLNEVQEENETLTKLIDEKNSEIEELKKSVSSLNEVLNSVPISELRSNSTIASEKLLELSKKHRQLKTELETTKDRLGKRDHQVQKLEKELKVQNEIISKNNQALKNSNPALTEELQTKLSALKQKLFETRNKNQELNSQLKLAQKCLKQEIGEDFNLNILASQPNSSNWRGRVQQILHLQQKIKELQDKLDGNKQNEVDNINPACLINPTLCSSPSFGSIDRPCVRKSELLHRAKVESLEKEIVHLKTELEDQRAKILALKVRNKTLNDEMSRYKQKASLLEEQTDFSNYNVASINERLSQQKSYYEKQLSESSKAAEKLLKEKQELDLHKGHLVEKITELDALILSKDNTIEKLNLKVQKLEQDLKSVCGDFLFSCRELKKEDFIAILDSLEAEKKSLLELNKTLNERLAQERIKSEGQIEHSFKHKTRISRLEVKLRELERELEMQAEKKKRSQRIADYTANLNSMGSTSSCSSLVFENTSISSTTNNKNSDQQPDEDVNDLKNRLEVSTEKIAILKDKLDYLTTEKENDVKTFHDIINNSKNVLIEMIQSHYQINNIGNLQ